MFIFQDNEGFNFSLESVLLPRFVTINKKVKKIMDIGTGNAPIPLILSRRTSALIIGVEIQKEICKLAIESVNINGLESRIEIINGDIKEIYKNIESDSFDVITCNPPYFRLSEKSNVNNNDKKTIARHEKELTLDDIFLIARKLLKNGGYISIVHRPERLVDIIEVMRKNNIEPKRIRFVHPHSNENANILLIEGVKNGKRGIKIDSPLISHEEDGKYSKEVMEFFE